MNSLDDRNRLSSILKDLRTQITELNNYVDNLAKDIRNQEPEKDKGISLLELKAHSMLNYLSNISYLSLRKLHRKSIRGDDAVFRLAETRTVLERMRPIEQKLQYQIDKLVKAASSTNEPGGDRDALSFKPNPDALIANNEEDEQSEEDNDDAVVDTKKSKVYVPPKLMAMPYSDESEKTSKAVDKAKKRALSSSLIRDLQEQYGHGPEEISEVEAGRRKVVENQKDRMRYEEDNFVRLQISKAQKRAAKHMSAKSTLQSLLDFGDYNMDEPSGTKQRKKSSSKRKGRGKGKGKGKRK